jgi:hypothetical protein
MSKVGAVVVARRLSDSVAWAGISCRGYAELLFLPSAVLYARLGWPQAHVRPLKMTCAKRSVTLQVMATNGRRHEARGLFRQQCFRRHI